jgi:type IV pilus assembly protein PilA
VVTFGAAFMRVRRKYNSALNSNRKNGGYDSRGFSLIELLVVVAIILIIAAIAIPSFLRARIAANEAAAANNTRTITTAAITYSSTYQNGYPSSLATMGPPLGGPATCDAADLIDTLFATAPNQKSGYTYAYIASNPVTVAAGCGAAGDNNYLVTATPMMVGITGSRSFCSEEPGVIHYDSTGAATASAAACEALPEL